MAKRQPLQRITRTRKLTPAAVAKYNKIREQVQEEFPPTVVSRATQTDIFADLRAALRPKGTKPLVRLSMANGFYPSVFVEQCIDELERKLAMSIASLYTFSKLELLAIDLLRDSAGIPFPRQETDDLHLQQTGKAVV